jgi:pyruvate formate lyase activating enzyme
MRPIDPAIATLQEALARRSAPAALSETLAGSRVRCVACGHRCVVLPGLAGICKVRFNQDGVLRVPRGYVAGLQVDPIEKKPFFHAFPGGNALSFGMLGCDLHCAYCQNWLTSQALRDPAALSGPRDVEPEDLVALALAEDAPAMVTTYNEPLITAEWAVEVFAKAKRAGLTCGFVSNGNATPEVLEYIRPYVDLYKVDLKGFRDAHYRTLGGRLDTILDTIRRLHAMGFWVEIVTLLIPGFNDDRAELTDAARFLASVSPDIPWHLTAFHADYKMRDTRPTSPGDLLRAADIGREAGLRFVYAGNLPGRVGDLESTRCPRCARTVIGRFGYRVTALALDGGACAGCGEPIPGFWPASWTPAVSAAGASRFPRPVGIPRAS